MGNKFDYNFIKTKLLSKVFIEWKDTLYDLYSEEGVFRQGTDAENLLELTISKEFKKSIKSVNKGVKQFKKERKKLVKKGLIDVGYEKLQFMYETGIYTPLPDEPPEGQEEPAEIQNEELKSKEPQKEDNKTEEPAPEKTIENKDETGTNTEDKPQDKPETRA